MPLNALIDAYLRAQGFSAVGETVESNPVGASCMISFPLFGGRSLVDVCATICQFKQFRLLDKCAGGIHDRHHDVNELNLISCCERLGREKRVQLIFCFAAEGL